MESSMVQLCACHMNCALKLKLREKAKLSDSVKHETHLRAAYDITQTINEFDFIDPAFYLTENDRDPKKYIICLPHVKQQFCKRKYDNNEKMIKFGNSYFTDINDKITPNILPVVPFEIGATINNMPHNSININEDPEEEALFYIELNWALFEQAVKQIITEKSNNN
ncbi:hypothetical protein F8M41_004537 [Gigaspora margarita]|uniref:Uncharacterized protein n=1 Tax=Gigaspora margarita TaxID=4874 RepID=A0A8H3XBL6_GIGMA|nr:hypothetical protein F8M41_004537 [Gigaspora margarita]